MKFSNRLDFDFTPNPLSRALVRKKEKGEYTYDLTGSNPTDADLSYPVQSILNALTTEEVLLYSPNPKGHLLTRQSIVRYYQEVGCSLPYESIFLTSCTSEAYGTIFKLLGNPGDSILIPKPGYPLLSYLAAFENLRPITYPLSWSLSKGWHVNMELIEYYITPSTRAIVVVNPNNPTGNYLKSNELKSIQTLCRQYNIALIADEVFFEFPLGNPRKEYKSSANETGCLTFTLNGISKMLGLPQMKLGWLVVNGEEKLVKEAVCRLEMLFDFYLSVGTPIQMACPRLLDLRSELKHTIQIRLEENLSLLGQVMGSISNIDVIPSEGGWYSVLKVSDTVTDEIRCLELLEKDNVLVHPGYYYDFDSDGFIVLSLLTPSTTFLEGLTRLAHRYGK